MKENILHSIGGLVWMLLMWLFLAISRVQQTYYDLRKIKYTRTCEGFVQREKSK